MIQKVLAEPVWFKKMKIEDLRALTPLIWAQLSIYDNNPIWDKDKRDHCSWMKVQVEHLFGELPKAFQLELVYWAKTNKFIGEFKLFGVSVLDTGV